MKSNFLTYIITISLSSILFSSCTNDTEELRKEIGQVQLKANYNHAFLTQIGSQTIKNTIELEIDIPENAEGVTKNDALIVLPFYKISDNNSDTWFPIPSIQSEKNYKVFYSRSNDLKISLILEKLDSPEPFQNLVKFENIDVVTLRASALKGLTRNDLDLRDYKEVVEYFNLK